MKVSLGLGAAVAAKSEVTMRHGEWVVFKGRYWLSGGGQNARHTAHGGLSLAEVLVPVLEAKEISATRRMGNLSF